MSSYADGLEELAESILKVLDSPGSDQAHLLRIRAIVAECLPSPEWDAAAYYKARLSPEEFSAWSWGVQRPWLAIARHRELANASVAGQRAEVQA